MYPKCWKQLFFFLKTGAENLSKFKVNLVWHLHHETIEIIYNNCLFNLVQTYSTLENTQSQHHYNLTKTTCDAEILKAPDS